MSTERAFFPVMEEFGFFSHIYEKLPEDFTAIFEIARVLDDELSALSKQLSEVVRLPAPGGLDEYLSPLSNHLSGVSRPPAPADSQKRDKAEDSHRYTPAGDRYAAD